MLREPPWYGTVRPVVWEDGGREAPSYPMLTTSRTTFRTSFLEFGELGALNTFHS